MPDTELSFISLNSWQVLLKCFKVLPPSRAQLLNSSLFPDTCPTPCVRSLKASSWPVAFLEASNFFRRSWVCFVFNLFNAFSKSFSLGFFFCTSATNKSQSFKAFSDSLTFGLLSSASGSASFSDSSSDPSSLLLPSFSCSSQADQVMQAFSPPWWQAFSPCWFLQQQGF